MRSCYLYQGSEANGEGETRETVEYVLYCLNCKIVSLLITEEEPIVRIRLREYKFEYNGD